MKTDSSDTPQNTPIQRIDKKTQREIAREGGSRALHENVGHDFNADNPPGHPGNTHAKPAPGTGHKLDEPGEAQHHREREDQEKPLEHVGATENPPDEDVDQVVKGRPPLKELAQLGDDEQGDSEDQDEDYQPRDEITPG